MQNETPALRFFNGQLVVVWQRAKAVYRWCDAHLEVRLMNVTYGLCAIIVCVEAVRRYAFRAQAPWSPMAAVYLFVWFSWIGCAYNVKVRSHLRFEELRRRLPYTVQFILQQLDYAVWILLGAIISYYSVEQIRLQMRLGSVVQGTDSFPLWVAFVGVPFGWLLILWRTCQCIREDIRRYRAREPLVDTFSLGDVG